MAMSKAYIDLANQIGVAPVDVNAARNPGQVQQQTMKAPSSNFVGNIGHSLVNIAEAVPHVLGTVGASAVKGVADIASSLPRDIAGNLRMGGRFGIKGSLGGLDERNAALNQKQNAITSAYKNGKISKEEYTKQLKGLLAEGTQLSTDAKNVAGSYAGNGQVAKDATRTGALAFAALTPFAAAESASTLGALGAKVGNVVDKLGSDGGVISRGVNAIGNFQAGTSIAELPGQIAKGNLKGAAGNAAGILVPAEIGLAGKALKTGGEVAKTAFFGKASGPVAEYFGKQVAKAKPAVQDVLKRAEQFTLNQPAVKGDLNKAKTFFSDYLTNTLKLPKDATAEEFATAFQKYAEPASKLQALREAGAAPRNAVLSADFRDVLPKAQKAVLAAPGKFASSADRLALAKSISAELKTSNPRVANELGDAVFKAGSAEEAVSNLKDIAQKNVLQVEGFKPPKGFIVTFGPSEIAKVPALGEGSLTIGQKANPILGKIGSTLEKTGLSPLPTDNAKVRAALTLNLGKQLEGTKFAGTEKDVLSALQTATSQTKGIFDPRLLKLQAIEDALNVTRGEARTLRGSLDSAYNSLPLSARGLGGKLTDAAISKIPGERQYIKAQGYGRFTGNPIFWAKRDLKTELIAQAEVGGKKINLGRGINKILGTAPEVTTQDALAKVGYFSKSKLAGGEADFFGNIFGDAQENLARNLAPQYIRQSMGQLAEQFAKNNGTTVDKVLAEGNPLKTELDHLLELTIGYPKDGFLNSNLAKTLNVVAFPSRFEAKVAMAGAKYLAEQPPMAQVAIVKGLLKAHDWANSADGKKWAQNNSELVGIINYFSPTKTINDILSTLKGNAPEPGDAFQLGGLPFGVISTILENQGIVGSSPYHDPKTGEVVPKKLPLNVQGRVKQGITDLLSSLFSYPGRTVGADSKSDIIQSNVPGLKPGKGEFSTPPKASAPGALPAPRVPSFAKPIALTTPKTPSVQTFVKPTKAKRIKPRAKHLGDTL